MRMTERQMSISCWYWIYYRIESGHYDSVYDMKRQYFVDRHKHLGLNDCLFCIYCEHCRGCPLSAGFGCGCYRQVADYAEDGGNEKAKQDALSACLRIIEELVKFPTEGKTVKVRRNKR